VEEAAMRVKMRRLIVMMQTRHLRAAFYRWLDVVDEVLGPIPAFVYSTWGGVNGYSEFVELTLVNSFSFQ
jgi:hypothetical protein